MNTELNWEEVCKIVREEQFECFTRSEENIKKYEKNGIISKGIYKSTKDMILINMLNHKSTSNDGKLVAVYCENNLKINLCPNNFPYSVKDNISHLLLWSEKELTYQEVNEILKSKLNGKEYIYFRNPEHLRSVPSVFHIQIFVKL